jgi:hypothetical protein
MPGHRSKLSQPSRFSEQQQHFTRTRNQILQVLSELLHCDTESDDAPPVVPPKNINESRQPLPDQKPGRVREPTITQSPSKKMRRTNHRKSEFDKKLGLPAIYKITCAAFSFLLRGQWPVASSLTRTETIYVFIRVDSVFANFRCFQ